MKLTTKFYTRIFVHVLNGSLSQRPIGPNSPNRAGKMDGRAQHFSKERLFQFVGNVISAWHSELIALG